jgi:glycosyltransferase involved in cell wall biosynthesis
MRMPSLTPHRPPRADSPLLSVIVPVLNRQAELEQCLAALREQRAAPPFEIIVIDDGSEAPVPEPSGGGHGETSARVIRQQNSGAGSARNAGIAAASGAILVFVDSDVTAGSTLLRAIADAACDHPEDVAFQVRLASTDNRLSHRMENARLTAIQRMLTRPDGSIGYVNTSAFAVRRSYAALSEGFFDVQVSRGEDTLILAQLARDRFLPRLVPVATAYHQPPATLARYILKHFKIGYQTREARTRLYALPGIALSWPGRLRMVRYLAEESGGGICGSIVFALALFAYALEICGRAASRWRPVQRPAKDARAPRQPA